MKKLFAAVLSVIMLLGTAVFASCTEKEKPPVNPGNKYDVDVNLDYDVTGSLKIGITTDGIESVMMEKLIEAYNQVYPNVTVKAETIAEPYNNTLVMYYRADEKNPGRMPDILMTNSEDMHSIIENKILLNLQPYVDASIELNKLKLDDFYPEMWLLGKKDFNGDQYVIPRSADRVVTHINQRIFNDCFGSTPANELPFTPIEGTVVPANGWTWQEFLDTCAALRKYYDEHGMKHLYLIDSYVTWVPVYYSLIKSAGAELIDNKTGEIKVETTAEILAELKALISNRYIAPFTSSSQANYEGGQGAMMFHSAYAQKWYGSLGADYNLTTFPLYGETPYIGTGVSGYGIYSRSQNRDLAWTFVNFMLSVDGQNALASGGMTTNPIRKDMSDPATNAWGKTYMEKGINMSAYTFGTQYCTPVNFYTFYPTKTYSDILDATNQLISDGVGGNLKISEAIEACRDTINGIIM